MKRLPVIACWLLVLAILVAPAPAAATVTAQFWDELGGSATGDGVSLAQHGVPLAAPGGNRNVWLAVGPDGRQVAAYVDGDTILVRRWNGATWDLILGPGLASGNVPQLAIDANGRTYLAWRQFS
ncbi:MAG TPA: hypothetical protein VFL90_05590, partial [Methylomirabilota bacterium]|nr:hypothetical protein [Methylomirabilota bacterium]